MLPRSLRLTRSQLWQFVLPAGFAIGMLVSPSLYLFAGTVLTVCVLAGVGGAAGRGAVKVVES